MERIKQYILIGIMAIGTLSSCQKENLQEQIETSASKSEMDQFVLETIKSTNEPFDWNNVSDERLYQALTLTDNILVIGYSDGLEPNIAARNEILASIYSTENITPDKLGDFDDVLIYKDDDLGFVSIKISKFETVQEVRKLSSVSFAEVNGYPIDREVIQKFTGNTSSSSLIKSMSSNSIERRNMILDPYLLEPSYTQQVFDYDNSLGVVVDRHRLTEVYETYQNFGEGIDIAVIDNGIVPWARELFEANGYGGRYYAGFHNPWYFLPWVNSNDGIEPLESDALGISFLLEPQWLHGSGMIQSAFIMAPNANITSVRGSTAIIILWPDQIYGIANAIKGMANKPEIDVTNMSMGTVFYINRITNAINYYTSKGKILATAAGTSFEEIKDLIGVIYPANLPNTVAVTGIENRETTDGEFIEGETAHTGAEVDFCVEKSAASSEATARMVGMFAVIWSANPNLTKEEVYDIAKRSSHFYQLQGFKDPKYGWGTVDMLQAVEMAME